MASSICVFCLLVLTLPIIKAKEQKQHTANAFSCLGFGKRPQTVGILVALGRSGEFGFAKRVHFWSVNIVPAIAIVGILVFIFNFSALRA